MIISTFHQYIMIVTISTYSQMTATLIPKALSCIYFIIITAIEQFTLYLRNIYKGQIFTGETLHVLVTGHMC